MIFDSHIHIAEVMEAREFAKLIENKEIGILANASSISEYEELGSITGAYISFGIHPWDTHKFYAYQGISEQQMEQMTMNQQQVRIAEGVQKLKPYFQKANAIGEIGMDSVWCQWDLKSQREIFIAQLDMAEELQKPVVLHTKGQEWEIAGILQNYSIRKLIHWYSCEEYLLEYIKQDCYFTVGPNFAISPSAKALIEKVPINRLLVETDGISAVEWVITKKITPTEIPSILREAVSAIAEAKHMTVEKAEEMLEGNFYRFIGESS